MELAYFADEVNKENFDEAVRLGVEAGSNRDSALSHPFPFPSLLPFPNQIAS